ncbi:MAG TPA: dATP/dGTP diphosphohydrolase domain-containing protein [Candidatus Saccharimonadales bacterium]|nr:dATP/dGTP diphosphohydrolase domain-containing protein [Candidatus Saccharimonadales bacterium]
MLPPRALNEVGRVLTHGAAKYGPHNWRGGLAYSRIIGATLRHILAYMMGEDMDPETDLPHIAHAACNLLFLIEYTLTNTGQDDRYKSPPIEINPPRQLRYSD